MSPANGAALSLTVLARQPSEKFGEGPHEMAAMLEEVGMAAK